jgi:hypothetical protein
MPTPTGKAAEMTQAHATNGFRPLPRYYHVETCLVCDRDVYMLGDAVVAHVMMPDRPHPAVTRPDDL